MSGTEQATVIVVNWNGWSCLSRCLASLRNQSFEDMTTIVVDNGSTDGSAQAVRQQYPEVVLMALPENRGFSAANNIAIRSVRTEYVALLNNDAIAHPQWLRRLTDAMRRYPEAGFAASKMLYLDMPHIIDRAGDGYTTAGAGSLRGRGLSADAYCRAEWIFGACAGAALYRMRMLEDIGLFDEDFFLLYEDVDLSFRAQLKGYRCRYVPDAVVYHQASRTIGYDSPGSVYYGHRNLEWVYFQNMPASLLVRTAMLHLLYTMGAFVFFTSKGLLSAFIRAKRDSMKNWKTVLNKRKKNLAQRRVADDYIWSLLEAERSFSRLSLRLKKPGLNKGQL